MPHAASAAVTIRRAYGQATAATRLVGNTDALLSYSGVAVVCSISLPCVDTGADMYPTRAALRLMLEARNQVTAVLDLYAHMHPTVDGLSRNNAL